MIRVFLMALSLAMPNFAFAMKVIGNGGDMLAYEFISIANEVTDILERQPPAAIDTVKLRAAIAVTEVQSTHRPLTLNGYPKDAMNYPSLGLIVVRRMAWNSHLDFQWRATLVLHEYLGIMGIDDSKYEISGKNIRAIWYAAGNDAEVFSRVLGGLKEGIAEVFCRRLPGLMGTIYKCRTKQVAASADTGTLEWDGLAARELYAAISIPSELSCTRSECAIAVKNIRCYKSLGWLRTERCSGILKQN